MAHRTFDLKDVRINSDRSQLDERMIIKYLQTESYWARDRSEEAIERSIQHSLCFGVYYLEQQIGFARAVTDRATVFYLADIFVLQEFQNMGIGRMLTDHILSHNELKGLRGILTTQTAHQFYGEFGFSRDNDVAQRRIMILESNKHEKDH